VRFCTNPAKFSVLGVDPTFNFGKFYATYRHLLLCNNNGVHPVRIGPVMVHTKKQASSYYALSSPMVRLTPEIRHTLVNGTDGEKALSDGLGWSFAGAQHLLCDLHMKHNVAVKLKEVGINGEAQKTIIHDIFGRTVGSECVPGLIDAESSADLDKSMEKLKEKWTVVLHCQGERFVSYFIKHKLELIRKSMTANIRTMAGLGWPPNVYDQNANECINSVLRREKQRVGKKEFARLLQSPVDRQ
jgi:hypothetical protein